MSFLSIILSLVVWGLIFWLIYWGLGKMGIAEPFKNVINVILVVASIIIVIGLLTGSVAPFPFLSHF